MKAAVLGTGMIGASVVIRLANGSAIDQVLAVDIGQEQVDRCVEAANQPSVTGRVVNLSDENTVIDLLREVDIAISCLPAFLTLQTTRAAIAAGCHLVDLSNASYLEKLELQEATQNAGVLIVPGCGVAPGIVGVLAARGVDLMDEAEEVMMICGGLPRHPLPPLYYQVVFSVDSLFNLYRRKDSLAAENGELVHIPPFSGIEPMVFPEPVGECEAVITGAGSVPYTLRHKVKRIYEKTVRYKGHWPKLATLYELGYFDDTPIEVNGVMVSPYEMTKRLLAPQMKGASSEDVTVVRVIVTGVKDGQAVKMQWDMIDQYDSQWDMTSMSRTTGFPAVIVAELIAAGKLNERGIMTTEQLITGDRFDPFISALDEMGVQITCTEPTVTKM